MAKDDSARERIIAEVRAGKKRVHVNANNGRYYVLDERYRQWDLTVTEIEEFERNRQQARYDEPG